MTIVRELSLEITGHGEDPFEFRTDKDSICVGSEEYTPQEARELSAALIEAAFYVESRVKQQKASRKAVAKLKGGA